MQNIVSILNRRAAAHPDKSAFRYFTNLKEEPRELTYQQLHRQARNIACELQQRGLAGQRALLVYPAGLDFIAAFMGCLYARVVAVPLWSASRKRSLRFLQNIASDTLPAVGLTTVEYGRHIDTFMALSHKRFNLNWMFTEQFKDEDGHPWREPAIEADTLAYLQYTSGSTTRPRGVKICHGNLLANSAYIEKWFGTNSETIGLSWLPHYHDMGLVGKILEPIYTGCSIVFTSPITFIRRPMLWIKAISHFRATVSGAPNYAYDICADAIKRRFVDDLDLSCWRVAFNGAEPVGAETIRKFSEVFTPWGFKSEAFSPCYGLAESTLMVAAIPEKKPPLIRSFDLKGLGEARVVPPKADAAVKELVSCGTMDPNSEVVIVDPKTGIPCRPDRIGEVWTAGPSIAKGYWNDASPNGTAFKALMSGRNHTQYLRTGDLGFIQNGHLYITGRLKELIILGGVNYYPHDIEKTVEKSHPAIRKNRSATFQIDRQGRSDLVIVAEINKAGANQLYAEVVSAIRQAVMEAVGVAVEEIVLVKKGTLPVTTSGKIQRMLCKKYYRQGLLDIGFSQSANGSSGAEQGRPAFSANQARDHNIKRKLAKVLGIAMGDLKPDISLYEQGLSSMRALELIIDLEQLTGVPFDRDLDIQTMLPSELIAVFNKGAWEKTPSGNRPQTGDTAPATSNPDSMAALQKSPRLPKNHVIERAKHFPDLEALKASGQLPFFKTLERNDGTECIIGGRKMIMLGSNNYLGLTASKRVRRAAAQAVQELGPSLTGSRLLNGSTLAHVELEKKLAAFLDYEDALVFTTGYQANLGLLSALLDEKSYLVLDDHCHASIYDGGFLAKAMIREFRHNDPGDLDQKLAGLPPDAGCLVMVDGVYSMMGDIAPLPAIEAVCKRHQAPYAVDEAHALGVLGATGRGTQEHFDFGPRADLLTGTFSKALASIGGWIAGESKVIDWIRFKGRPMLFSASLPPASVAAAATALDVLISEPERVRRLSQKANRFRASLARAGFKVEKFDTPIIAIFIGGDALCFRFANRLLEAGIFVNASVYPAVPRNRAVIRTSVMATHTEAQLDASVDTLIKVAKQIRLL